MKLKKILALVLTLAMLFTSAALILPAAAEEQENYEAEVLGASIRTTGNQGLRFIGKIRKDADIHPGDGANFGFLLIPASMVGSTTVWDEENKANIVTPDGITSGTGLVKTVPAEKLMSERAVAAVVTDYANDYDEYYYFTAVITNVPATFYGVEILARIYVTANEVTTYSDQLSRSVQYVANAINEMGGDVPEFITALSSSRQVRPISTPSLQTARSPTRPEPRILPAAARVGAAFCTVLRRKSTGSIIPTSIRPTRITPRTPAFSA